MNAEHLTCKKGSTEQTQCVFHSFRQRKLIYFEFRISSNVKGYFFRAENDKQICNELIAFLDIHRYHRCWRHVFTWKACVRIVYRICFDKLVFLEPIFLLQFVLSLSNDNWRPFSTIINCRFEILKLCEKSLVKVSAFLMRQLLRHKLRLICIDWRTQTLFCKIS